MGCESDLGTQAVLVYTSWLTFLFYRGFSVTYLRSACMARVIAVIFLLHISFEVQELNLLTAKPVAPVGESECAAQNG